MPEHVPENQHPLNQRAKALLKQAKARRDPTGLYVYQLLQWSLDQGNHGLREKFLDQLSQAVFTLFGADPEVGMFILLKPPGEPKSDQVSLPDNALDDLSPVEAAQELFETLHSQLQAGNPNYNP